MFLANELQKSTLVKPVQAQHAFAISGLLRVVCAEEKYPFETLQEANPAPPTSDLTILSSLLFQPR